MPRYCKGISMPLDALRQDHHCFEMPSKLSQVQGVGRGQDGVLDLTDGDGHSNDRVKPSPSLSTAYKEAKLNVHLETQLTGIPYLFKRKLMSIRSADSAAILQTASNN